MDSRHFRVNKKYVNGKEADLQYSSEHLFPALKIVTRNFLISMHPIRIDSRIQEALAFVLLRFCWRLRFLDSTNAASGSNEGTDLKKIQTTELTEDAQTMFVTSTNFEALRESLEGISRNDLKDGKRLKGYFIPNFILVAHPRGLPFNWYFFKLGAA